MALTAAGSELLALARRVLAGSEELADVARRLQGKVSARLRIGTVSEPELNRVGEFLALVVQRHPLLEVELHHEVSGAALEAVRDRRLDASLFFGELNSEGVSGLALAPVVYRVAAPAAWKPRVEQGDWRSIAAMPWVMTPSISTHNRLVGALFRRHGVEPPKVVEADNESVLSTLVASGLGLSLLREERALAMERAGEACLWPGARLQTTLWFVYPASRRGDPALAALLHALRELWGIPSPRQEPTLVRSAPPRPPAPRTRAARASRRGRV